LGKEQVPTNAEKKAKWDSKNDKAHKLMRISISPYLWFHLQLIDDPTEVLDKLEVVFGKHNAIQAHQLENH
jgi:hypothetical protein